MLAPDLEVSLSSTHAGVVGVMAVLLPWLADHEFEYFSAARSRTREATDRLREIQKSAELAVHDHEPTGGNDLHAPTGGLGAALADLARNTGAGLESALVARAFALGVDAFMGNSATTRLASYYQTRGDDEAATGLQVELGHNDLVPVASPSRSQQRVMPLRVRPYRTEHLTLVRWPGTRVVLDFTIAGSQLPRPLSVAAVVPASSAELDELKHAIQNDVEADLATVQAVIARARNAIREAANQQVHVLLFPEYMVPPAVQTELVKLWQADPDSSVLLLVPGTGTDSRTLNGVNRTALHYRVTPGSGDAPPTYVRSAPIQKAVPVEHLDREGFLVPIEHLVDQEPEIRVFVLADGMKVSVVICRDAITEAVRYALNDLEVDLILIPAMSSNVEPFHALAHSHSVFTGGSTLVANLDNESAALIGHPAMAPIESTADEQAGDERARVEHSCRFVVSILRNGSPLLTIVDPDDAGTISPRWVAI